MRKYLFILLIILCPLFAFSQNVGVGTITPVAKLDIDGDYAEPLIPGITSNGILRIGPDPYDALDIGKRSTGTYDAWLQAGFSGIAEPISLQPLGGNVGIGLLSPSEKLEVEGGIKADSLDVQSGLIKNVADPISAQDAATKAYVDANTSSPTYIVGLSAEQGGYIFWVSADGKHGLVAETEDQSIASNWYNTQDIISDPSNHSADGDDFRDWRMPTKYELSEMYLQKDAIGGFNAGDYWSSTENINENAWKQWFFDGDQVGSSQSNLNKVRAVRTF